MFHEGQDTSGRPLGPVLGQTIISKNGIAWKEFLLMTQGLVIWVGKEQVMINDTGIAEK